MDEQTAQFVAQLDLGLYLSQVKKKFPQKKEHFSGKEKQFSIRRGKRRKGSFQKKNKKLFRRKEGNFCKEGRMRKGIFQKKKKKRKFLVEYDEEGEGGTTYHNRKKKQGS